MSEPVTPAELAELERLRAVMEHARNTEESVEDWLNTVKAYEHFAT